MRVALVHDWLTGMRGGERVLLEFLEMYPNADIYTLLHIPGATSEEIDRKVRGVSWLNRIPFASSLYRHLLPFYPAAVRSLHLEGYELVISLSHAAVKNVTVPAGTKHLCYCFTPMRYIWDQAATYFGWKRFFLQPILSMLRGWDRLGAQSVTAFASISSFITARIRCFYKRKATVIYPPVRTEWIKSIEMNVPGEAYLYVGALVPYKRADVVIEAFNRTGQTLWLVGDGPLIDELKAKAHANIKFLGAISDSELGGLYHKCRALIFPGLEDFGLIPVECLASGRPVIAFGRGGTKESISGWKHWLNAPFDPSTHSGVFINPNGNNLLNSLLLSLESFEKIEGQFDPMVCKARAKLFSPQVFQTKWKMFERSIQ